MSAGWATIEADGTFASGTGDPPPAGLKVLPPTTRWKPHRDTTSPIDVIFRGPSDLDLTSVSLEVTPPATFSGSYTLRDDDVASLTLAADPSLAEQLLAAAYIRVLTHGVGTQSTDIPFQITPFIYAGTGPLDRRNLMRDALYDLPAEGRSNDEYWSIQLVSAFEGDPDWDLDPQVETDLRRGGAKRPQATLGVTVIGSCHDGTRLIGGCKPHAAIYLEVMRDLLARPEGFSNLPALSVLNQRITAHELLHGMTLTHGAAVMCAGVMLSAAPKGGALDSIHVKQLRDVKKPSVLASRRPTCP